MTRFWAKKGTETLTFKLRIVIRCLYNQKNTITLFGSTRDSNPETSSRKTKEAVLFISFRSRIGIVKKNQEGNGAPGPAWA